MVDQPLDIIVPEVGYSIWSACDRGDLEAVKRLLAAGNRDVNARNCLGCTPLLYACGSGHVETVRYLLSQPDTDVNRCSNDRLTSFMLAMQGGALIGKSESSWPGWENQGSNAHEKMKRLINLSATDELEWTRHDRWTPLMEACNFGHKSVVDLLVKVPQIDFEAINLRGQRAEDVAVSRGHDYLAGLIESAKKSRDNPEELPRIQELEEKVQNLKIETRQRLVKGIDLKYAQLRDLKVHQESEICPLSDQIDSLQNQLEDAMKQRLALITRHVRDIKGIEDEIKRMKKKLDNFDMYTDVSGLASKSRLSKSSESLDTHSPLSTMEKDFECSVCLEEMKPPVKIFQCRNGHVMCEICKDHPEVNRCPTCRIPLNGQINLLRNLPMEKIARSYFENSAHNRSLGASPIPPRSGLASLAPMAPITSRLPISRVLGPSDVDRSSLMAANADVSQWEWQD